MVERKVHSLLYKLIIFQKFLNTRDLTFTVVAFIEQLIFLYVCKFFILVPAKLILILCILSFVFCL